MNILLVYYKRLSLTSLYVMHALLLVSYSWMALQSMKRTADKVDKGNTVNTDDLTSYSECVQTS